MLLFQLAQLENTEREPLHSFRVCEKILVLTVPLIISEDLSFF